MYAILTSCHPDDPGRLSVGIAADGDAVVLWKAPKASPVRSADVAVAVAPAAGRFAPAVALGMVNGRAEPSLSLTADGHALVAFPDGHHEFRANLAGHEKAKAEARKAWDSVDVTRRVDSSRSK